MKRPDTILGIADAGRGAVIGPLIVAGVLFLDDKEIIEPLREEGVGTTNKFSEARRVEVMRVIADARRKQMVYRIDPEEIDEAGSVNDVEIEYSANLINKLRPTRVVVDTPVSQDMFEEYTDAIGETTFRSPEIQDEDDIVAATAVAAAKVVAREIHDEEMARIQKRYGDFGSGFPADKKTKTWLRKWKREHKKDEDGELWPDVVRKSWSTLENL